MSLISQIFAVIAIPATLLLLIQTVMLFLGIGDDADGGADDLADGVADDLPDEADGVFGDQTDADTADLAGLEGLRILTLRGIIAFLVVFGWVGVAMDGAGIALFVTLPVAAVCGFAMMVVLALLMRAVMKLRNSGNADNRNAIGVSGKVYLTVPAARGGSGKVHLMLQGSFVEETP
ncbi:MAG: hypothetical protein E7599_01185 [Ruminococcaceae bacterium]|nr:hypothetical protein [Oscillospiraceae bacterium]